MRVSDNVIKEISIFLEKNNISSVLLGFVVISIILFAIYKDVKNIDKNEKFTKILFSDKYNKEFKKNPINGRYPTIIMFFSMITFLLILIILISNGII